MLRNTSGSRKAKIRELELVISAAQRWAIVEAKALLTIRDQRLFFPRYETFEAYGQQRWGFEKSHLYRICGWAEVLEAVSPIGDGPKRESHARPLVGLTPDQQRSCWKTVQRRLGGSRTAEEIEKVVRESLRRSSPLPPAKSRSNSGTVIHSDAIDGVKTLVDGSVNLILTSPPYCEQRNSHYPGIHEDEMPRYMTRLFSALKPKMATNGSVLLVAREHVRNGQISDCWLRTRLAIRESGWREIDTLIWSKPDAPPLGRADRPRRSFEYVYWFSLSENPFADLRACGSPISETPSRMVRDPRKNYGQSGLRKADRMPITRSRSATHETARVTDVISAPLGGIPDGIDHPAVYPTTLCDQLIRTYSPVDGLVVDPFCGSGQTLLAARDSGRDWWGCDVVSRYVRMAQKRIEG